MKYRAILQVSPQFIASLVIGVTVGDRPRAFTVSRYGLPEGTAVHSAFVDQASGNVLVVVEHDRPFQLSEPLRMHVSGLPFLEPPQCSVYFPLGASV